MDRSILVPVLIFILSIYNLLETGQMVLSKKVFFKQRQIGKRDGDTISTAEFKRVIDGIPHVEWDENQCGSSY